MRIGDAARKMREREGLTMRQLAAKLGVTHAYVAKIEGGSRPSLDVLDAYRRVFGVDPYSLTWYIAGDSMPEEDKAYIRELVKELR